MDIRYPALALTPRTGDEPFHQDGACTSVRVSDFWRWAVSDLVDNVTRGRLAEFIVASALGIANGVRGSWDVCDLTTRTGLTLQVKSCAYLQSWGHEELTKVVFDIKPTRAWDYRTNRMEADPKRHSILYIFCLLHHQDKGTLDPLDLTQWSFYLVPTRVLDEVVPKLQCLSLSRLLGLTPVKADFGSLRVRIEELDSQRTKGSVD